MCARYLFELKLNQWSESFALIFKTFGDWSKWNIAPTNEVPVIRAGPEAGLPRVDLLRWGLVPKWAQDLSFGSRTINARSETAAAKPAFRSAFKRRRCLVPASGFYEWTGAKGARTAQLIGMQDGSPITFAGLWDRWSHPGGDAVETFTILTCPPNELVATIHDRMPVILPEESRALWLDAQVDDCALLQPLLRPYPAEALQALSVGTYVNNTRHQGPRCAEPERDLFS